MLILSWSAPVRTLAPSWFLLNLLPLHGRVLRTVDVSEKERVRLLGRWLGSCAPATAATLHMITQNTYDNEKKKDKQTPSSRQPTEERPMMIHPQAFWVQATLLIP